MPIEIKIIGANAEDAITELVRFADFISGGLTTAPAQTIAEVDAETEKAAAPPADEPKRRGRPKKEPEAQPANDEKPTMTAAQAEQWAQGDKTVEAQPLAVKPTRDDCMNAMRHVSEKFGYDHTRALLQKFDAPKLSLLPEEKYEAFIKAAYDWKAEVA